MFMIVIHRTYRNFGKPGPVLNNEVLSSLLLFLDRSDVFQPSLHCIGVFSCASSICVVIAFYKKKKTRKKEMLT